MRRFCVSICFLTAAFLLGTPAARGENWPNWRGPLDNGISHEKNIPVEWSPTKNVAWKVTLPGASGSTPVVWGDHIFLTTMDDSGNGNNAVVIAYDTSGKKLWEHKVASGTVKPRGDEGNNIAAPSPVTDGEHVWVFFGTGDVICYTFDGKPVWKTNLQDRYGKFDMQFGMTSTPVIDDNKLIFQLIHGDMRSTTPQPAWVIALDKSNGKQIWKQFRKSDAFAENVQSYASPVVYRDGKQKFLLSHGADYVVAHDLETGEELWRCGGLNPKDSYNRYLRLVASPSFNDGVIVVPSAKNGVVLALRPDGRGDVTGDDSAHYWVRPRTQHDVPSPLIVDGIVYICGARSGMLTAIDLKTGKDLYTDKRFHTQRHRASPVYADGHIYLTARDGRVTVVKAGPKFEIVAENDTGEQQTASPAVSNGTIYLKTFNSLWAIRNK